MEFVRKTKTNRKVLGNNNLINNNSREEIQEQKKKKREISLSLKKNDASTSGYNSFDITQTTYQIDSSSFESKTQNSNHTNNSLKRPTKQLSIEVFGKKIKLDDKPMLEPMQQTHTNVSLFQDTLDNVNVTKILNSVKSPEGANTNTPSNNDLSEFDAFKAYLDQLKPSQSITRPISTHVPSSKNESNRKELPSTQSDLFSQSFNTQILEQIDNVTKVVKLNNSSQQKSKQDHVFKIPNELPIMKSFDEKLERLKAKQESLIKDRSELFNNESVTSHYRKEVDNLFEKIEHSICVMGTENEQSDIPDDFLDVIFCDDLNLPDSVSLEKNLVHNSVLRKSLTDKNEGKTENLLEPVNSTMDNINCSFGTVIKQALINNATKAVTPQKQINMTLDLSLSEVKPEFNNLGPFYGLPMKVKELIKQFKGIDGLYDWQEECLKLPAIETRKNLIYALPTSGGKTLVAEILMLREVMCYKKNAIFILPYVAIVQEKVWDLSPFAVALDFLVEEYASCKGTYPPRKRRRKHTVFIATIEKALGLINSLIETGRLNEIGLIVVDELHLIGEAGRGSTLEACLTKIMFLNANIQIVGMSATIGNIEDIKTFLNADVYTKNFRPVELVEYVKCGNEIARINWLHKNEEDLLIEHKKIDFKYLESASKLDPDMLGGLVFEIIPKASCLIFCPSKRNCENVAYLLCKLAKPELTNYKKTEKQQLLHALKDEGGILCSILETSVQFGVAYHHSGLTADERRLIEEGFRAGTLYVICCTSTLAAGVNLPARRVILRSPYIGRDFISLSRYKQMAGRAGRAGLGEAGDAIIITQPADLPKLKQLLLSPMNQAYSSLHESDGKGLRHLLLSCISLGIANTRVQLQAVASRTLMAVQQEKLEVNVSYLTDCVIKNLFKLGALQESGLVTSDNNSSLCDVSVRLDTTMGSLTNFESESENERSKGSKPKKKVVVLSKFSKLVVSSLGCAAIKGGLELSRAHQLHDDLEEAQRSLVLVDCLHLLYLITPYEIAESIKPDMQIYYDVYTHLGPKELETAKMLGITEAVAVKMFSNIPMKNISERVLNRFYVTLMLYDLWNEVPVYKVSEKFQISRGIVQNLMTVAATFASNVVNFCEQLEEFWPFSYLLKGINQRLSHCCIKELLPLMELPAVKQSRAKQLYNAGFKTLQSIAKADANDLVEKIEFMSRKVASQLIAASKMLLLEKVENLREEAEDVLDGVENPKQLFPSLVSK